MRYTHSFQVFGKNLFVQHIRQSGRKGEREKRVKGEKSTHSRQTVRQQHERTKVNRESEKSKVKEEECLMEAARGTPDPPSLLSFPHHHNERSAIKSPVNNQQFTRGERERAGGQVRESLFRAVAWSCDAWVKSCRVMNGTKRAHTHITRGPLFLRRDNRPKKGDDEPRGE